MVAGSYGPMECPVCGNPKADYQFEPRVGNVPDERWENCDRCGFHSHETETYCELKKGPLTFRIEARPPSEDGHPSLWWGFGDGDGPVQLCEGDAVYDVVGFLSRFVSHDYVARYEYKRDTYQQGGL
jgi:hypothetical protein